MDVKKRLMDRLDSIAKGLRNSQGGLGLLGLGSVGRELERIDAFSDLDFFAIVEDGKKMAFMQDISWMEDDAKIIYAFKNTKDGYKILYEDGIFGEMAIFELHELYHIPYAPGRVIWQRQNVEIPEVSHIPMPVRPFDVHFEIHELLTNLLVGLMREQRGEHLSAMFFIQRFAFDRFLRLIRHEIHPEGAYVDGFSDERRIEAHAPELQSVFSKILLGYDHNVDAAKNLLDEVMKRWECHPSMVSAILKEISAAK